MNFIRSRYYLKILSQVLAVALIPTTIVGAILGIRIYSSMQERMHQMETLALRQTMEQIDEQLKSVQHSMLQFIVNQDTLRAVRTRNPVDDYQLFNRLRNNITTLMHSAHTNVQIDGVSIICIKNDWLYDSDLGYQKLLGDQEIPYLKGAESGWEVENHYVKNLYFENQLNNSVLTGYMSFLDQSIVAVKINYDDFCADLALYGPVSKLYIIDSDGRLLYGSEPAQVGMMMDQEPFYSRILESEGRIQYEADGANYIGVYLKSPQFGWTYLSVQENTLVDQEIYGGMTIIFLTSLAVILCAIFLVTFLSRRLYRPIHNLYERLDHAMDHELETGGDKRLDEMKTIEESVGLLIGDNSRLQNEISGQRERMRELMIYRLFSGHIDSDYAYDMLEEYNIRLPWENKALVGIRLALKEHKGNEIAWRDIYLVGIQKIVRDLFPENALAAPTMLNNAALLIIGRDGDDESFRDYVEQSARQMFAAFSSGLQIELQLAVSSRFERISQISKALDELRRVWDCVDRAYSGVILQGEGASGFNYPYREIESIVESIRLGDRESIWANLSAFMKNVYTNITDTHNQQLCLIMLLGNILHLAPDYSGAIVNQAVSSYKEKDLIVTLSAIEGAAEKGEWLYERIVTPLVDIIHTDDANKLFLINSMLRFIRDNPHNASDIEACASFMNHNSAYLRKIFKAKMGMSYRQYVAHSILERAKEMLSSSDLPVANIAEKLGYSNSQNFIRYFKREFGITPGQYRSERV